MNTQSEKRENSVLFSLRELKGLADDRVREEEEAVRQRAAAAQAAQQAELERVRREAEEARAAAERAERAKTEAAERQQREDALRLEEAERKARVDAQHALEAERLRLEIAAKAQVAAAHKKPKGLLAVAGVLVVALAGAGIFAYQKSVEGDNARLRAEAAAQDARDANRKREEAAAALAASQAEQAELKKQLDEAIKLRSEARTDEERAVADQKITEIKSKQKARPAAPAQPKGPAMPVLCPPGQPIC